MFAILTFALTHWYLVAIAAAVASAAVWYTGMGLATRVLEAAWAFAKTKAGIGLIAFVVGVVGAHMADRKAEALEALRRENATLRTDLTIAGNAKANAEELRSKIDAGSKANDDLVSSLERELDALKNAPAPEPKVIVKTVTKTALRSCPADAEAVRRLKEIK